MFVNANGQPSFFEAIKTYQINSIGDYDKFINWVTGEFDLYLKEESKTLKVYFPNGWFSIGKYKRNDGLFDIIIKGKSRQSCESKLKKIESIYNHIQAFVAKKNKLRK